MLAAVSPVSICTGVRQEDAGPRVVVGIADFRALVRGTVVESPAVSAKVEVVGGDAVCWSSKCSRVLVGAAPAAAATNSSSEKVKPGDAARRCKECTSYLDSVLLPRVQEAFAGAAAAAAAAASTTVGNGGSGGSEKREERESAAGTKRRIDESTTLQQPKPVLDGRPREVSPQAATAAKRGKAPAEGSRPMTEGVSIGQKVGSVLFSVGTHVVAS